MMRRIWRIMNVRRHLRLIIQGEIMSLVGRGAMIMAGRIRIMCGLKSVYAASSMVKRLMAL